MSSSLYNVQQSTKWISTRTGQALLIYTAVHECSWLALTDFDPDVRSAMMRVVRLFGNRDEMRRYCSI